MLESVKKKLEEIQIKFSQMESELSKPETIENQTKFTSISKEYSNLKPIVDSFSEFKSVEENIEESNQLLNDSDSEIRALAQEELESLNQMLVKQLKNRYADPTANKKFIIGVDRAKMKLYDVAQTAQEDLVDTGQEEEAIDRFADFKV